MANTTFKGPVRSQNGFLEWNGTAWVPVQGGGGGGVIVELGDNSTAYLGIADNRYSDNCYSATPTGDTAGNIIQLPAIEVGQSYTIRPITGGSSSANAWAVQLPAIPGTSISSFYNNRWSAYFVTGFVPGTGSDVYTPAVCYSANVSVGGPVDTFFLYGYFDPSTYMGIARLPNIVVPGFGEVALFNQSNIPTMDYGSPLAPNPLVYPFTSLIASP